MARFSFFLHTWRKRCAWLMLAALVWACLAPQLATLSSSPQAQWMDICTGMGAMVMQVAADDQPGAQDEKDKAATPGDCPFCRLHMFHGLPPGEPLSVHRVRTRAAPPPLRLPRPMPGRPWRVDLARAPPSAIQA